MLGSLVSTLERHCFMVRSSDTYSMIETEQKRKSERELHREVIKPEKTHYILKTGPVVLMLCDVMITRE